MLVARKTVLGRSNVADLAVAACSVRCKAGMLWMVDLGEALEVDLGMDSLAGAFGHHKEAVAGAAEVVDMTIGGDA